MSDPRCELCTEKPLTTTAEQEMRACQVCADRLGLIPMPPSRRPPAPCARCNSQQFLRVIPREHTSRGEGLNVAAPMYVTHVPKTSPGPWVWSKGREVHHHVIEDNGIGILETYICRSCGAVEWFCVDVERIPVHPHLMSEAIDYQGDTPYR